MFNTFIVIWTIILCISGQVTYSIMGLYENDVPWSRKEKVTNWAKFHRYLGYVMLFLGNLTCGVGTLAYTNHFVHNEYRKHALWIGPFIFFAFCLLVLIYECKYRLKEKNSKMVLNNPVVAVGNRKRNRMKIFAFSEIDE